MSEYENILRQIGSFGPYQRRAFILVSMFETPVAWAMLAPMLLNIKPDWFCYDWTKLQDDLIGQNISDPVYIRNINNIDALKTYQFVTNTSQVNMSLIRNACPDEHVCPEITFAEGVSSIVTQVITKCLFRKGDIS